MIKGIKHIIFDLGGVLLNIDYHKTTAAFQALGVPHFDTLYSQREQIALFDALETGKIDAATFYEELNKLFQSNFTHDQLATAWNAMLLDWPLRRLQILQQLQNHFDLYLLSNTNSIHEAAFTQSLQQAHGIPSIAIYFDKAYFSHRLGLRKPNHQAFQYILDTHNLSPAATLFIDDSLQHIVAAKSLGIQTIHLSNGMTIEKDIFKPLI